MNVMIAGMNTGYDKMSREKDIERFYALMDSLERKVGEKRKLANCTGRMDWPERGVYFFFGKDEKRDSSDQLRVTRIGTQAVTEGSSTTLWKRLRQHRGYKRGSYPGGGNQRGSIFRRIVGEAMIKRDGLEERYPKWTEESSANKEVRDNEYEMEKSVSEYIRALPFLWLKVNDEPGKNSDRAYLESNSIALLSNYREETIDPRSESWLGKHSSKQKIRQSGLWNSDHVEERHGPDFLEVLKYYIERM